MENVTFGTLNTIVLSVYIVAMLGVGLFFAGRQRSIEDFYLAGRKLPWLAVAMSMYASVTSAMTFMGLPGLAYRQNISLIIVCFMSPLIAPVLAYLIYPVYRKLRVTTSYEYIALRFGRGARMCVALLFVLARVSWLGTVIFAPALALNVTTGISLAVAIGIIGFIATIYCVLGGLSAVVWTDVPQFLIMMAGAVLMAVVLCGHVPDGAMGILREGHLADKLKVFDWSFKPAEMTALAVAIAYAFMLVQDYGVDQVSVQRLLAVNSNKGVVRAIFFNAFTDFFIIGLLLFIGLGLFVFYQQNPGHLPGSITADKVLPWFILHELPAGISGLIIAALFAAAMSSFDSGLNSLCTVILHDIASPLSGNAPGAHSVTTARLVTGGLGVLATLTSLFIFQRIEGIIESFYTFMGLFSAPVLALFLLGLITRRAHFLGWLSATLLSIAAVLFLQHKTSVNEVYYFPFSAMITLVAGYLFSLVLPSTASNNPNFTWREVTRP